MGCTESLVVDVAQTGVRYVMAIPSGCGTALLPCGRSRWNYRLVARDLSIHSIWVGVVNDKAGLVTAFTEDPVIFQSAWAEWSVGTVSIVVCEVPVI